MRSLQQISSPSQYRRLLDSALSGSPVIELPTLTHFLCDPFVPILFVGNIAYLSTEL
jgi:hypothetical protein